MGKAFAVVSQDNLTSEIDAEPEIVIGKGIGGGLKGISNAWSFGVEVV
jgi:hypothetical protein